MYCCASLPAQDILFCQDKSLHVKIKMHHPGHPRVSSRKSKCLVASKDDLVFDAIRITIIVCLFTSCELCYIPG